MRKTPDAIMLFAAGFGTRMGALTADQPKPMIPVSGRPLIDHALDLVAPLGLSRVVANLHYKPQSLAKHLKNHDVLLSYETPDILETGGGLRAALPLLGDDPVYTMNTDAVWSGPNPLQLLAAAWDPAKMDALLICIPRNHARGHNGSGDFVLAADGCAKRGPGLVYGGAQIIKTDGLAAIKDHAFSLNILWNNMLENNSLFGLRYPGQWCDVGHPEGIQIAEKLLGETDV